MLAFSRVFSLPVQSEVFFSTETRLMKPPLFDLFAALGDGIGAKSFFFPVLTFPFRFMDGSTPWPIACPGAFPGASNFSSLPSYPLPRPDDFSPELFGTFFQLHSFCIAPLIIFSGFMRFPRLVNLLPSSIF